MGARNGIDFFPMETDALTDDEMVFDLMEAYGRHGDEYRSADAFAAFGRWMALLCQVYRHGPALVLDDRTCRKVARDLGMGTDALIEFVDSCSSAGLVDRRLWKNNSVITSLDIQLRWGKAKKRKDLPADCAKWSLLPDDDAKRPSASARGDGKSRQISEKTAESRQIRESLRDLPKTGGVAPSKNIGSEKPRLDKKRLDKKREEENLEISSSSVAGEMGADVENLPCACMAVPSVDGTWYADDAGTPHETPAEALEQRYIHRTGLADFDRLMASVAQRCPASCRASPPPDHVSACYSLLSRCVDKFDPSKGGSPLPLAMRMIEEDRGW